MNRMQLRRLVDNGLPTALGLPLQRLLVKSPFLYEPEGRRHLFLHIPRTAGGSIAEAIEGRDKPHFPLVAYAAHDPARLAGLWKFTFVRDPADRFASAYARVLSPRAIEQVRLWGDRHVRPAGSLERFAKLLADDPKLRSIVLAQAHFRPQTEWITVGDKLGVDYIGRFESLQADFEHVRAHLGLDSTLPWKNRSNHSECGEPLSPATRAAVQSLYARDYALLNY
jgi:hypothetical protein